MSVFKHFIVLQLIINYSIILAHNPPPHSILDLHWEECEHPLIYSMCYLCIIYLFYVFIYKLYAFSTLNNFWGHKILTFIGLFFYIPYLHLVLPGGQQTGQGSTWLSFMFLMRPSLGTEKGRWQIVQCAF